MLLYPSTTYRRDPFLAMRRFQDEFNRAFAPFIAETPGTTYPAVNVWQSENSIAVTAELPGVEAENIEISVKDDVLTLSGEREVPELGDKAIWHMRERPYGHFVRTVRLPYRVDPDKVDARFTNGVLQVEMQRPESDRPRRIQVKAA